MSQSFTALEVENYRALFKGADLDKSGKLDHKEVQELMGKAGEEVTFQRVGEIIGMVDKNSDGEIDFDEFLACMQVLKAGGALGGGGGGGGVSVAVQQFGMASHRAAHLVKVQGAGGAMHSISDEEREAFAVHINNVLGDDAFLKGRLPMDPQSPTALFDQCKDGIIFAKLVNVVEPGTVDERALNLKPNTSKFQLVENNNLAINAAKAIGCHLVNIGAANLMEGKQHLVLGVAWQIIRKTLLVNISLKNHPELFRLLEDGETLEDLARIPPEKVLLRWLNFQLNKAGSSRRVGNFGADLKDSEVYSVLLHQLDASRCPLVPAGSPETRAAAVLSNVTAMGIRPIVKAKDIVSGNAKLNLGLVAQVFNANPGLAVATVEEIEVLGDDFAALEVVEDDTGDSREERTFRLWVNSLNLDGVEGAPLFVTDLYHDLSNGLNILKVMDRIKPGAVPWKKTHAKPRGRIHLVDNCNQVVTVGRTMGLTLVNIGGMDIADKNKKLILSVMWQLMRQFTLDMLKQLQTSDDALVTEKTVVDWANTQVVKAGATGPPGAAPLPKLRNCQDKNLADGVWLLRLCAAVAPRTVDWSLVTLNAAPESPEAKSNARYAISVARKIGACVFITPEDIMETKPKMLFSFMAAIWLAEAAPSAPRDNTPHRGASPSRNPTPPRPTPAPAPVAAAAPEPAAATPAAQPAPPPPKPTPPAPAPAPAPPVEAQAPAAAPQVDANLGLKASPNTKRMTMATDSTSVKGPPVLTSPNTGFASINGSGEIGGLYGAKAMAVTEEEGEKDVEDDEWD